LVSLLLCFGIVVCSKHITFHIIIAYKLHVNCTEGTNKFYSMWVSVHAVVRGIETCFQQVSNYFLFLKFLKPYFKTLVELCFLTMFVWFVFHNGCVAVRGLPLSLYACLCEREIATFFQHQVSKLALVYVWKDTCWIWSPAISTWVDLCETLKNPQMKP
jgi:hypothetical protein